jgi:predicted transcriptional regulator
MFDDDFLEEVSPKHKVLYLLMNGWTNFNEIQDFLEIPDKEMKSIIEELSLQGVITTYTIH